MAIRINVIGASGCGASTLGRLLASALSVSYFDSDDYYHAPSDPPFQNPMPPTERHTLITKDLRLTKSWVLGGGVAGWQPYPKLEFTHVILLYVPTDVRIERSRKRELDRFGDRIGKGGDMYETHEEFIQWSSRYDAGDVECKTLARHEAWLGSQTCPVIKFDGELELAAIKDLALNWIGTSEREATS